MYLTKDEEIERQIRIIKEGSKKLLRSKKAALKFLVDAGIMKKEEASRISRKKKK